MHVGTEPPPRLPHRAAPGARRARAPRAPPSRGRRAQGLRDMCTEDGALLCFDEVMTGFRIAKGCAQAHFGITPDLTTVRAPSPLIAQRAPQGCAAPRQGTALWRRSLGRRWARASPAIRNGAANPDLGARLRVALGRSQHRAWRCMRRRPGAALRMAGRMRSRPERGGARARADGQGHWRRPAGGRVRRPARDYGARRPRRCARRARHAGVGSACTR